MGSDIKLIALLMITWESLGLLVFRGEVDIAIWSDDGEEDIRICREVSVDQNLSGLIEDADVEGSGMEIYPAGFADFQLGEAVVDFG